MTSMGHRIAGTTAAALGVLLTSSLTVGGTGASADQAGARAPLPTQVTTASHVHQMITVTSRRWNTTRTTVRAWQRNRAGRWELALGPFDAVIGWNGWIRALRRQQSSGTTPAGKFDLPRAFGALADPGTALPYERFDDDDYWPYEPRDAATYNVYQQWKAATTHWRPGYVERLWDYRDEYAYSVVIGFNLPDGVHYSAKRRQWVARERADTSRGGGIFLHARKQPATAGCVAVYSPALRRLLRWLEPADAPRIVMGPRSYVVRL